jgi:hypothetical protein
MLCFSEWKETIQVKKGLDYHLSVVKLVNALLLRKEGNHPGKKGLANPLSSVKLINALLLREERSYPCKKSSFCYQIGQCSATQKGGSHRGKKGWLSPALVSLSVFRALLLREERSSR